MTPSRNQGASTPFNQNAQRCREPFSKAQRPTEKGGLSFPVCVNPPSPSESTNLPVTQAFGKYTAPATHAEDVDVCLSITYKPINMFVLFFLTKVHWLTERLWHLTSIPKASWLLSKILDTDFWFSCGLPLFRETWKLQENPPVRNKKQKMKLTNRHR